MNSDSPKVTVLMSVYNGEEYLKEAVESILKQTFRDFEFIIIDDGSTDTSGAIVAHYQQMDDRIHVYSQENKGLIASLNRGCQLAKGKYIARMDADDVSLPERLARQVNYLETHPNIGVLGTWVKTIDEKGRALQEWRLPTSPKVMGWSLLFGCCVAHPSVMMRRDIIRQVGFYRPEALYVEDYDLWARANNITQIANIPEILFKYRFWEGSIRSQGLLTQEHNTAKIMHLMIEQLLGSDVPMEMVSTLQRMCAHSSLGNFQQIDQMDNFIRQLYRAYLRSYSLTPGEAREVAQDAAMKLTILAVSASKISLRKGLLILGQALRTYPQMLLSRQIISKGVTKGIGIMLGRA